VVEFRGLRLHEFAAEIDVKLLLAVGRFRTEYHRAVNRHPANGRRNLNGHCLQLTVD